MTQSEKKCLSLLPFGSESSMLYDSVIRPVVIDAGYSPWRLDEITSSNVLASNVWRSIEDAALVIADLSGKNPNVFYELGLAHALRKPTVLLTKALDDVPFDLRHLQVLTYGDRLEDTRHLRNDLRAALELVRNVSASKPTGHFISSPTEPCPEPVPNEQLTSSLLERAASERFSGNLKSARDTLHEAISVYRTTAGNRPEHGGRGLANALNNLATVYQETGEYSSAMEALREAVEILKRVGDAKGESATYGNLANVFEAQGDYSRAQEFYERALEITSAINDIPGHAAHLSNLASLSINLGELSKAREYYSKSLEEFHESGLELEGARTLANLGRLEHNLGDSQGAEKLFLEAAEVFKRLGKRADAARVLHNLGLLAQERGEFESATKLLNQSLATKVEYGDFEGRAATLSNLGAVKASQGQLDAAMRFYNEAAEIYQRTGNSRGLASVFLAISRVLVAGGANEDAIRFLEQLEDNTRDLPVSQRFDLEKQLATLRAEMSE